MFLNFVRWHDGVSFAWKRIWILEEGTKGHFSDVREQNFSSYRCVLAVHNSNFCFRSGGTAWQNCARIGRTCSNGKNIPVSHSPARTLASPSPLARRSSDSKVGVKCSVNARWSCRLSAYSSSWFPVPRGAAAWGSRPAPTPSWSSTASPSKRTGRVTSSRSSTRSTDRRRIGLSLSVSPLSVVASFLKSTAFDGSSWMWIVLAFAYNSITYLKLKSDQINLNEI